MTDGAQPTTLLGPHSELRKTQNLLFLFRFVLVIMANPKNASWSVDQNQYLQLGEPFSTQVAGGS